MLPALPGDRYSEMLGTCSRSWPSVVGCDRPQLLVGHLRDRRGYKAKLRFCAGFISVALVNRNWTAIPAPSAGAEGHSIR